MTEHTISFLFLDWLPVLYIIVFLYLISKHVIFILCVVLTNVLHEVTCKGTCFVPFLLCLVHFVYSLMLSFNDLMQEIKSFQRGAPTMAMFTLLNQMLMSVIKPSDVMSVHHITFL